MQWAVIPSPRLTGAERVSAPQAKMQERVACTGEITDGSHVHTEGSPSPRHLQR